LDGWYLPTRVHENGIDVPEADEDVHERVEELKNPRGEEFKSREIGLSTKVLRHR
jgi:hypothetical protein